MWNSKVRQQSANGITTTSKLLPQNLSQQQPAKQFGMTSAISWDAPSLEDLQKTEELQKVLESYNIFETKKELNHRMDILAKLNALVKQWIKDISIAKSMPEEAAQKVGGKIFTFGSYRLGVHHKGADIDALCVAPRNIEHADYFTSFFKLLKKQPEITECRSIEEAFVPVIKMNFDGVEIDLLFARLSLKEIPDDFDLRDTNILKNLDDRSVRSLNGCRVTDEIMSLVPNIESFHLTLNAIKLWAKKHGIYSNSLGYFGGVTWAMLVARICQLYPNAAASTLVHKFFLVFSRWKWPNPVLLKHPDIVNFRFPVWDPRVNVSDRYHLMPVITPAYPQQNSTFNVTESTKKIILTEINRGMSTTDEIMLGNASWDRFFESPGFFSRYRHFIVLLVNSKTVDGHLEWCGLVESKIRFLIGDLERNPHISLAHVNTKCFDYRKGSSGYEEYKSQKSPAACGQTTLTTAPYCSMWFIGLEFERTESLNIDLTKNIRNFVELTTQHGAKVQMLKEDMSIDAHYVKRKQLSQYLDEEILKRDRKSLANQNNLNNSRKRLSSEMQPKYSINGKRLRVSESHDENANTSSNAGSEAINSSPKTPVVQQQMHPSFNKQPTTTPQQQTTVCENNKGGNSAPTQTISKWPDRDRRPQFRGPLYPLDISVKRNASLTDATLKHCNTKKFRKIINPTAAGNSNNNIINCSSASGPTGYSPSVSFSLV